ncbi:frizzled-8-like [Lampetra planeri]
MLLLPLLEMKMTMKTTMKMLLLLICAPSTSLARDPVCQEITVPMCRGIGYNHTYMPNDFRHDSQEEAGLEVHQFWPLVEIHCSPDLRFFLCSMYTPICLEDYKQPLPPCRSVCERARAGCAPLMRQYGFAWPDRMRCDRLPEQGSPDSLCMDHNRNDAGHPPGAPAGQGDGGIPSSDVTERQVPPRDGGRQPGAAGGGRGRVIDGSAECEPICGCRAPLVRISSPRHVLYDRVRTGQVRNCATPCHSPFLGREQRTFASFWIGLWSSLCFVATFATVSTFLIDMERFKYPERPIIFLSLCCMLASLGYIVRMVAGHEAVACSADWHHVLYASSGPALCTAVFLLTYFFGMAGCVWWVILSLTWFMAAGLKWGSEAIAGYSQYYHLAAWLLPSIKAIAALAMNAVDGDPVAGICSVGNQSLDNLRGFVLAPLVAYLLVGTAFLLAGLVALFRIRNAIKQQQQQMQQVQQLMQQQQLMQSSANPGGAKTEKLERLMVRIGVFAVLYTVPAAVAVVCHLYEQQHRDSWERTLVCGGGVGGDGGFSVDPSACGPGSGHLPEPGARPDFAVFMLKYFVSLVGGITSGAWIWSGKTAGSWKRFYKRCRAWRSGKRHRSPIGAGRGSGSYPKQLPFSHV